MRGRCPDDNDLELFLDGRLPATRALAVAAHVERCPLCRELVCVLAGVDPHKVARTSRRTEQGASD